ncbi:MAG: PQQ-binding-like beta-propeller repeat protein [Planctomycetota bacterium]
MDWPNWRGPEHNGMSREVGLVDSWSPDGENLLWKNEELGGRSTPIVMRGKLYNIVSADPGTPIEGEKVVCVDAATGKKIWENKFKVFNSDVPAERVGWSSVVGDPETGNVYAQGVCGLFLCLDGETGKTIWSRSLTEEYGLLTTYGGRTNVPVVFDDLVIISGVMIGWGEHARPNHRYIAFDKKDGTPVWFNATRPLPDDTTYSTPVLAIVNGEAQLIGGTGDGNIYSIQPRTGKILWNYTLSLRGLNVTPLVVGNTVYVSQSEENPDAATMGAFVAIDATGQGDVTKSKEVWREKELMIGKSSPVIVNGLIYSIDDGGGIFVIDSKTGKVIKKQKLGTMMRSSPLYADGKIYTCDATGRWYILKPTPKGFDVIHKLRLRSESHGSPIVSHGRIYIPMLDAMYCIGKSDAKPSVSGAPDFAEEAPVSADPKPAQLQIVPVEALLKPGQQQKFVARLFNSKGQFVGNADKVKFTTDAKAPIQKEDKSDGVPGLVLGAAKDQKAHQGITITAEAEGLKSTARARLFPDLPWKFDFADGNVPLPWVGARYRHVVRDLNGEKVMVKVTTIPKGTRSIASFGPVDLHDYTIQADVRGQSVGGKLPDIGLTAQRYTLELMGASQQLRILDWPPVLRNVKSIPYAWKPDVWYTMKLRASNENGKAVLKGKIWERNTPEPSEWTLEVVDELPSTEGSPGLYGNAKDAEIYLDNISVTKN